MRVNSLIGALMPATIFLVVPFLAMVEEMTLSEVFRKYPFISTLSSCCAIAFGALIFIADKKIKESVSVADRARNTANKESIVVTNTRIFGSTNTQSFSVPISEIKNTYIERKLGKSSSVISNEVLCVICEKETLCFEFFENNSEISNAIKTALPPKSDYRTTDNITKNSDHKDNSDVYNIKITDYATYLSAIKAIREITLTDYVSAKQFLDKLPAVLVENAPKEKADKYARILEQIDVIFEIYRS